MPTSTSNFGLLQPLVNSSQDEDLWGGYLNSNIGNDDALLLTAMTNKTVAETANFSIAGRTGGTATTGNLRDLFLCNCTSAAITASLPAAASVDNGFIVAFKKEDSSSNTLTIAPAGSDTIDGGDSLVVSAQYDSFVLVSDGASNWNIISYKHGVTPKSLSLNVQQITASDTYIPTPGTVFAIVEMTGGGGGGGGVGTGFGSGSGGGSGAYIRALLSAAQIGASQDVTVGAAGAAGANTGASGGTGGTTLFGYLLETTGGAGGEYTGSGGYVPGGAGGTPAVTTGLAISSLPGQAGEGSATIAAGGNAGSGGSNPIGFGGVGVPTMDISNTIAGNAGTGFGSGGSGAINQTNSTAAAGGPGAPGVVTVTEFIFA